MAIVPCVKPLPRGFGGGKGERIAEKSLLHSLLWKTRIAPAVLAFSIRSLLLHTFSIPMSARKRICLSPKLGKKNKPVSLAHPLGFSKGFTKTQIALHEPDFCFQNAAETGNGSAGSGGRCAMVFPGAFGEKKGADMLHQHPFFRRYEFLILRLKRAGDSAPF